MSEILDLEQKTTSHVEATNEGGESSRTVSKRLDDQSERPKSPSINGTSTSLDKESQQSVPVSATGQQFDERIENLVSLFRDFLEVAPTKAVSGSSHITQQDKAGRKRVFGMAKGFSPETGSNNRYDYEEKYPRDKFGEEASDNARVWLTYLDEAESFDRERAEGWKETVDVLLVFAGLFSGVITTFISQASQSLQKDNTQVSASLLSETVQLLRANFSGVPASDVPTATLTPTSPFTASTNTLLVNGLWFTSLAITLSTALFAVLAKQWLYYYLSSIPGTANEKARARQLRLNGFESWKVAAIVELLPILLHLAVGMFLTGIIILLFPLDIHIAGTIAFIAGITYTLYFISVILPIWYPECPYTTSLTIYIGIFFFILQQVVQTITAMLNLGFQTVWRQINFKAQRSNNVGHLVHYAQRTVGHGLMYISRLAGAVHRGLQRLGSTIFSYNLPKFTKWREENIRRAVKHATSLDFEALVWLYETSQNRSVHRIIARCAAVHPTISKKMGYSILHDLCDTLEINEANTVDIRHVLCLGLEYLGFNKHWELLKFTPNVVNGQLEEEEYQSYLCIADVMCFYELEPKYQTLQMLRDAINGASNLPLSIWCQLLAEASTDATVAMHILIRKPHRLFKWRPDPARELIRNAGLVSFSGSELGWWQFEYMYRYFGLGNPEYSLEAKSHETRYLLFTSIYRNLTSDDPIITDKEKRQASLESVVDGVRFHFPGPRTLEDVLRFFRDIYCVDSFWCESMTDRAREWAVEYLSTMTISINTQLDNSLPFTDHHDLSLIYQWYSRDLNSNLTFYTPPLFLLLLVPQNRHHLSTILLNDLDHAQDRVSRFSKCLLNLENCRSLRWDTILYPIIMDFLKSVGAKKNPLFTILYDPSVLFQLWKLLVFFKHDTKGFFRLIKSKLGRDGLDRLFSSMNELAQFDDLENLFDRCGWDREFRGYVRPALAASAREFGRLIGVSHTQLEVTTGQSAPGNAASNKDHDTEERAQVSAVQHQNYRFATNWMKKVFESIWSKTPVK